MMDTFSTAMPYSPKDFSEAQNKAIEKKIQLKEKYRELFQTPLGQEVLVDILRESKFFSVLQGDNPYAVCYHDGKRSLALHIVNNIYQDGLQLLKLMDEVKTRNENPTI